MQKEMLNGEVMQEFMDGFADKRWTEGKEELCFKSEDEHLIVYSDYGSGPGWSRTELTLWKKGETFDPGLMLQFYQEVDGDKINNFLIVPPYLNEYWNVGTNWCGVVYGPDGRMDPIRRVKGLPRKIDMDKTVELFLRQVAEKNFATPVLVKAN